MTHDSNLEFLDVVEVEDESSYKPWLSSVPEFAGLLSQHSHILDGDYNNEVFLSQPFFPLDTRTYEEICP
jgi:hypothetical protein